MDTKCITGSEIFGAQGSAVNTLCQFYQAFNNRDYERMQNNWLQSVNASMSNPLGGIKRGWNEIKSVYQKIFGGPAKVYVEYYDYTIDETEAMFVAVGRERGYVEVRGNRIELAIRTSRIYIREKNTWKQLHHHGSIDDSALLCSYQTTLMEKTKGEKDAHHVE